MEGLASLIGESPAVEALRDSVRRLLHHPPGGRRLPSILIEGETGAGKGLLARIIHRAGPRAQGPFVDVNCAAIPDTLLEAELFGFERGAFTDARRAKPGLFQTAHRGMIFLDEVGLLPEGLQAKLLKVIEEREVRRLGSTRSEPVDAWVLSATNADLLTAVAERRFREDLYHRLAVIRLRLPSLRERGDDIVLLAEHFLARACEEYALPAITLGPDARAALLAYAWPGNIRELTNLMERVALLSERAVVTAAMLDLPTASRVATPAELAQAGRGSAGRSLDIAMRDHLLRVLGETGWNISRSAAVLGISRNTLRSRIERLGLHRSGERPALAPAVPVEPAPAPPLPDLRPVASTIPAPGPAVVRWERRRVTLLRAEIYPPPDAEGPAEASRALETIMEKVRSFGGWTQDLAVTWIGAAFGVAAVEDGPRRAVHAAMAIQKAAERGRRGDGEPFAVRFGVHVAEFLVGQTGIGLELDADAKQREGATLASLIETAAADTIVATSAAAPFLERHFDLTPIAGATAGYRLVGRERPSFTLGRRPAHFVGRQQELTLIRSRLDSARAGRGQIVGIVGEAGIGKSRLLYELRQTLRGGRVTYLEGRCFSYGTSIPYLPVLEIVRQACRVSDSDTPEAVHRKLAAAVAALGLAPEDTVPYLLNFLGIKEPGTADRRSGLSPDALRKRTIDVLRQMAARASARQPLVLAVEDFHWIDNASASLTALVESLMALPILVILTYRPGVRSSWLDRPHVTQLALQPLSPEESLNVVTAVLPPHLTAAPVARAIVAAAEGNPFFLEELARSIRDRGQTALTDVVVPETVEEVLRARIDHLPDRERSLLQAAAVIGKHVPPDLLRAVADLPEEPFEEALARLQAAEFLYETEAGDEAKYSFKHQLTQEVAYRSLLPDRRRALHARIVDHVERHSAAHLLDQSATLAQHTVGAERWEKAATYLREAGARALARSANREAAARFEEALGVLPHLPEDRRREELAIDLRFDLRNALTPLAEMEATIQALREAEALAQRLGDRHRLGRALSFATNCLYLMGNARSAIEAGTQARSLAEDLDDLPLQVATDMYVGRAYHALGDYRRAIQTLERPVGALVGDRVRDHLGLPVLPAVFSRALLATSLAEVGDFRAGARLTAEARSLAEAARHADTTVWACWSSGYLLLLQGDSERAGEVLEQALAVCRANDLPTYAPRMSSDLGLSYALRGRVKDGIEMIERAVEEATARKQVALLPALTLGLGHAYLLGGRAQEARDIGSRSLIHAREHGERGHEAYALRMLADGVALAERDAPAPADEYYRAALALATDLGMRPLTAWCQLGLGQLLARVGQRAEARAIVTTAAALFREMEMGAGFAQAEGALYRLA